MKYALALCLVLSGCAGAQVTMLTSQSYPKTSFVRLLTDVPEQEYEEIALIEGNSSQYNTRSDAFKAMLKKARKIGAEALIIVSIEEGYNPGGTYANPVQGSDPITIMAGTTHTITGVAIRFK